MNFVGRTEIRYSEAKRRYTNNCPNCIELKNADIVRRREETHIKLYGVSHPFKRKDFLLKKEETNLSRFGVRHASQNVEIRQKIEQVCMERYGAKSPLECKEILDKIANTNIERYGSEYPIQNDIVKQRVKDTMMERYGVEHTLSHPEFRAKTIATNLERYGVGWSGASIQSKEKRRITNIEKYGTEYPAQNEIVKEKIKQTNLDKFGVECIFSTSDYHNNLKKQNNDLYGVDHINQTSMPYESYLILTTNKEQLIQWHHEEELTIGSIAKKLNVSETTVSSYFHNHDIEIKWFNKSNPEKELCSILDELNIVYDDRNRKILGNRREIDIVIPDRKIAIEYNGLIWHSEFNKRIECNYHNEKYSICKDNGFRLITIFENEWLERKILVIDKLKSILNVSDKPKVHARKCLIQSVSTVDKRQFFEENHIQGDGPSSINYGLYHDNQLVACIGFVKQKDHFVLNRYATSCNVVGGFTKLLTHFEREYNKPKIVTFADLRWSEGDLYKNTGFVLDKELAPDYYWVKGMKLWHKFNWRHTSGLKKLENYDPNLTEVENMHNHGYYRIWDCGKLRFTKN